ncbi:hypothetical protein IG631_05316 [Alternaria alternata]|nr:hypothetical protein IG631_05316 [Alternaria alternata]
MALVLQGPILRNEIRDRVYPQITTPVPCFIASRPVAGLEMETASRQNRDSFLPAYCFHNLPWLCRLGCP